VAKEEQWEGEKEGRRIWGEVAEVLKEEGWLHAWEEAEEEDMDDKWVCAQLRDEGLSGVEATWASKKELGW
jgi:hypothetical protein